MNKYFKHAVAVAGLAFGSAAMAAADYTPPAGPTAIDSGSCSDCVFGWSFDGNVQIDVLKNTGALHHISFMYNPNAGATLDLSSQVYEGVNPIVNAASGFYNHYQGPGIFGTLTSVTNVGDAASFTTMTFGGQNAGYRSGAYYDLVNPSTNTGLAYFAEVNGNTVDLYLEDLTLQPTNVLANNEHDVHLRFTITPVPEPETYGMMALGLGVLGFMARRRKQSAGAAA